MMKIVIFSAMALLSSACDLDREPTPLDGPGMMPQQTQAQMPTTSTAPSTDMGVSTDRTTSTPTPTDLPNKYDQAKLVCQSHLQFSTEFDTFLGEPQVVSLDLLAGDPIGKDLNLVATTKYEIEPGTNLTSNVTVKVLNLAIKEQVTQKVGTQTFQMKNSPVLTVSYQGKIIFSKRTGQTINSLEMKTIDLIEKVPTTLIKYETSSNSYLNRGHARITCQLVTELNPRFSEDFVVIRK